MNEEVLKSYEELKRNRNIINTIEPDFFFEIVDCLLKENEELKAFKKQVTDIESTNFIKYKNYITVQKVKDKIEELKKKVEELTDDKGYWGGSYLLEQIKVLQELLEENENHIPRID